MAFDLLVSMLERGDKISRSKSSVLVPLQVTLIVVVVLLMFFVLVKAPNWLLISSAIAVGAILLGVLSTFVYFARKDPDQLRSDHFALTKYAIDKTLYGDSESGLIEVSRIANVLALESADGDKLSISGARQKTEDRLE